MNSINTITLSDFSYILTGLNAACSTTAPTQNQATDAAQQKKKLQTGEHIVGVWADENDATGRTLTWQIGVVEAVDEGGATVSYLVQTNCNKKENWIYPKSAATFYTPFDQIIANNLSVEYSCVTIIRCRINKSTITQMNDLFREYMDKL